MQNVPCCEQLFWLMSFYENRSNIIASVIVWNSTNLVTLSNTTDWLDLILQCEVVAGHWLQIYCGVVYPSEKFCCAFISFFFTVGVFLSLDFALQQNCDAHILWVYLVFRLVQPTHPLVLVQWWVPFFYL